MNKIMDKIKKIIFVICLILILSPSVVGDYSITVPTYFENAKINLTPTQNLSACSICIITTNVSDIPINTVSFYTNNSYINFTATSNKTISNIAYDNVSDKWTWTASGTDGILITKVKVLETEKNYALKVDNSIIEEQRSTTNNLLNYSYSVWDGANHNFEISRYTAPSVTTIIGGSGGGLISWYSSLKNVLLSVPTPEPILTQSSEIYEQFIPSVSPYIIKNPFYFSLYSIYVKGDKCKEPVYLERNSKIIKISSSCKEKITINFIFPVTNKTPIVYKVQNNKLIKPKQKITGISSDKKYYKISVIDTFGSFIIKEESIKKESKLEYISKMDLEIYNSLLQRIEILTNIFINLKNNIKLL